MIQKNLFEDFTWYSYRNLLNRALEKYTFASYLNYEENKRQIILRHDVDYSISRAVKMAEIEHSLGIRSTFFVFAHSEGYNLYQIETAQMIKKIISLGHEIGLHIDFSFYQEILGENNEVENIVQGEIRDLEKVFKTKIMAVSFHQPEYRNVLDLNQNKFAGVVNAYSEYITQNYKYCSDSNGYWRFDRLQDLIDSGEYDRMQILLHPIWWTEDAISPAEKVVGYYKNEAEHKYDLYCEDIKRCGRINLGEERV